MNDNHYIYSTEYIKGVCSMNDVINELNLKERIIVKIFVKTFNKVYNVTRLQIINSILK